MTHFGKMSDDEFLGFDEQEGSSEHADGAKVAEQAAADNAENDEHTLVMLVRRLLLDRNHAAEANNGRAAPERNLHPVEVDKLIPVFSNGRDVKRWCANVNHFKALYNWSELTTLLYASCRLDGAAREWYRSVQNQVKSWMDFQQKIQISFPDDENDAEIHLALSNIIKSKDETYENFLFKRLTSLPVSTSNCNSTSSFTLPRNSPLLSIPSSLDRALDGGCVIQSTTLDTS